MQQKDIDAVFIATPNHHHFLPSMIAMQLGKGVYTEKPMAHSIQQARQMAEAYLKYKVPTQMGNQGHYGEGTAKCVEYLQAGAIGKVTEVHCWTDRANGGTGGRPASKPVPAGMHWDEWIGPSPFRDYHDGLHPHGFHDWYDFGNGSVGNMACHICDCAVVGLKLKYPTAVTAEAVLGGSAEQYPTGTRVRMDFAARGDMPALKFYWWDGNRPTAQGKGAGRLVLRSRPTVSRTVRSWPRNSRRSTAANSAATAPSTSAKRDTSTPARTAARPSPPCPIPS